MIGEPTWLMRAALRARWLDAVLRRRADGVLRKSGLSRGLPARGLLLDIGAGTGHITEAVLRAGPARRCVAVDPSWRPPPPLEGRLDARFALVRGGGEALPFADGCFDGGWCAFVLHHLPLATQATVLAEMARVLRPGGVFVLLEDTPTTAAERAVTLRADRRLNFEDVSAPHHYRAPAEWRTALAAAGFRVIAERGFRFLFPPATLRPVPHSAFLCEKQIR